VQQELKRLYVLIILSILLLISACSNVDQTPQTKNGQLLIYTSIYPIQFLTEEIGGKHVVVENLIPPGSDAHTFEPDSQTMMQIARGDAFVYTGVGLEGFVTKLEKSLQNEKVKFYKAANGINLPDVEESDHGDHEDEGLDTSDEENHADVDPHIWLDPLYTIEMAENIKSDLISLKPDAKADFEKNYEQLKEALLALHHDFTKISNQAASKEVIVSHAAYGYWEKRYGISQIAISGLSPNQEPTQKGLKEIIEKAREHNIKYIMFEKNVSSKVAEVVRAQIGAEILYLSNLESLTQEQVEQNETYLTVMKNNVETLKRALEVE
jgi:zinc transport system substrate-binding protein